MRKRVRVMYPSWQKLSPATNQRNHAQICSTSEPYYADVRKLVQLVLRSGVSMRLAGLCAAVAVLFAAGPEFAAQANNAKSRYMRVHGQAIPPYGFLQFCRSFSSECRAGQRRNARFAASLNRLIELDEINRKVNRAVLPATDAEIYGVEEFWTFPKVKGDCEDYVVLKRRLLMNAGWPASALLITVVMDENGDGHAVLTARTTQGDFVLDNKTTEVKLWSQTPYRYVMRQSFIDPNIWMSLDPRATVTPQSLAGFRTQ